MLSTVYGGIHAGALRFLFPFQTERLLWKISCLVCIAESIPATIAIMAIVDAWSYTNIQMQTGSLGKLWDDWGGCSGDDDTLWDFLRSHKSRNWIHVLLFVIAAINLPVFIAARIYIVLEAFLSLRHTTIGAYATVQWAQYIPHF